MENNFSNTVQSQLDFMNKSKKDTLGKLGEYFQNYENVVKVNDNQTLYTIPVLNISISIYVCSTSLFCTFKKERTIYHKTYMFSVLTSNEIIKELKAEVSDLLSVTEH